MDDSEMARRALDHALTAHPAAAVTVLHVVGEPSGMMGEAARLALADDVDATAAELAEAVFERARAVATEHDREIDTVVEMGHPARAIVRHAPDYDLVVVGSHGGRLADNLFVGDVARRVFRRSPVPVTVVR
jgi:nucleotide-binding universal stress UspA family protein